MRPFANQSSVSTSPAGFVRTLEALEAFALGGYKEAPQDSPGFESGFGSIGWTPGPSQWVGFVLFLLPKIASKQTNSHQLAPTRQTSKRGSLSPGKGMDLRSATRARRSSEGQMSWAWEVGDCGRGAHDVDFSRLLFTELGCAMWGVGANMNNSFLRRYIFASCSDSFASECLCVVCAERQVAGREKLLFV